MGDGHSTLDQEAVPSLRSFAHEVDLPMFY